MYRILRFSVFSCILGCFFGVVIPHLPACWKVSLEQQPGFANYYQQTQSKDKLEQHTSKGKKAKIAKEEKRGLLHALIRCGLVAGSLLSAMQCNAADSTAIWSLLCCSVQRARRNRQSRVPSSPPSPRFKLPPMYRDRRCGNAACDSV